MIYEDIFRFQYDAHCKLYILHYNLVNVFMQTRCCDLMCEAHIILHMIYNVQYSPE